MPGEAGPVPVPVPAPAPEPEEASPTPAAKPVLASTLLSNLLKQHHVHQQYRDSHRTGKGDGNETERVSSIRSGFDELDDYVLMGGVERGPVVGISGDVDGGGVAGGEGGVGRLVSDHFIRQV
jgi:hypothetical protein